MLAKVVIYYWHVHNNRTREKHEFLINSMKVDYFAFSRFIDIIFTSSKQFHHTALKLHFPVPEKQKQHIKFLV